MKNYYQILEISEIATNDEIKKQYRFLSQAWHPDKFPTPEQKEKAEEKIKSINEAYSILGNPRKRRKYDSQMGYEHEQPNEKNTQSRESDFRGVQGKEKSTREKTPAKIKNRLTTLWIVFGVVGTLLCMSLIVFVMINPLSERSQLPTDSISPTSTNHVPPATPEVNVIPIATPTLINTNSYIDNMILIPAGDFTMGRNDGAPNEAPSHLVSLNNFYIDKYEVTNSMYGKCVDLGFCKPPTKSDSPSNLLYFGNSEFDAYPVIYVTWDMAGAFCGWREARLPTEAEWEKTARGNDIRIYPWGNEFMEGRSNFCDINCPMEWANRDYNDGYADTAPVGSFPQGQSPYGVFDISGNVYEWVADWYSENYYLESEQDNPIGPAFGKDRVIRGGAWSDQSATAAISRASFTPLSAYEFVGFRCARSINE